MQDTRPLILRSATDFPSIHRESLGILQVNLGYKCNLSCVHCHVNAGPSRTEVMDWATMELVLEVLDRHRPHTLDLTGGAPELNPHFRRLVTEARAMGVKVIDRCNLTVLFEPGQEGLAEFLAEEEAEIVASLPCYQESNVDSQRGKGTYELSIEALQKLNALGYGQEGSGLALNLVYNPTGPFLPPPQEALEQDYKRELASNYGIVFNSLLTITNMPISRFGAVLLSQGEYDNYMKLLKESYSRQNLDGVMCRTMVSVDWQGNIYDCDFNQMLEIPAVSTDGRNVHLKDLAAGKLPRDIIVADHCYGCTAGQGSSCGGALG